MQVHVFKFGLEVDLRPAPPEVCESFEMQFQVLIGGGELAVEEITLQPTFRGDARYTAAVHREQGQIAFDVGLHGIDRTTARFDPHVRGQCSEGACSGQWSDIESG